MSAHSTGPPPIAARIVMWMSRILLVSIASVVVASVVTRIAWELKPRQDLDVLVFDQTVASDSYAEHAILGQLFDYHKVEYDYTTDYYGTNPDGGPHGLWPTEAPDIIVLADAYGVYVEENLTQKLISDYLTLPQAVDIRRWVSEGVPSYAEFAMVYNPTPGSAGDVIEDTFGFVSTPWVFRFWDNLTDVSPNIKKVYIGEWDFEGPGIVLVSGPVAGRETEPEIVVLTEEDLVDLLPLVHGGAPGAIRGTATFDGWASVVEAAPGATVEAEFELPVTDSGAAKLDKQDIPAIFPALIRRNNTLYFAGNGLADETPFRLRHLYGSATFTRLVTGQEFRFFYTILEPSIGWLISQVE